MTGLLSHSVAEIIYQYLLDNELIDTPTGTDWPGYINNNPPTVDSYVTVKDTTGRVQGKIHTTSETVVKDGLQIMTRGSQLSSFRKISEIANALETILRGLVTIDSSSYTIQAVTLTSTIIAMGKDLPEADYFRHSVNAIVSVRRN